MDHKLDLVWIGRFLRPHGLKGEMKVAFNLPAHLKPCDLSALYVRNQPGFITIESVKEVHDAWLLKLHGIESPEQAKVLSNVECGVEREMLGELPESEFYIDQLVGLKAIEAETNRFLGNVSGFLNLNSQPVVEIERPDRRKFLIPFIHEYIVRVSVKEGTIWLQNTQYFEET